MPECLVFHHNFDFAMKNYFPNNSIIPLFILFCACVYTNAYFFDLNFFVKNLKVIVILQVTHIFWHFTSADTCSSEYLSLKKCFNFFDF